MTWYHVPEDDETGRVERITRAKGKRRARVRSKRPHQRCHNDAVVRKLARAAATALTNHRTKLEEATHGG